MIGMHNAALYTSGIRNNLASGNVRETSERVVISPEFLVVFQDPGNSDFLVIFWLKSRLQNVDGERAEM